MALIGDDAFRGCTTLSNVFIATTVPPKLGLNAFMDATQVIFYYFPGSTSWNPTWAGRPARQWNPHISIGTAGFGIGAGEFGFQIAGTMDIPLVVEASPSLFSGVWVPVAALTLTNGLVWFKDAKWEQDSTRHYRIRPP